MTDRPTDPREVIASASWPADSEIQIVAGHDCADAILTALRAEGLVVVPVEPTEAIAKAGCYCGVPLCSSEEVAKAAYRAMIRAATGGEP